MAHCWHRDTQQWKQGPCEVWPNFFGEQFFSVRNLKWSLWRFFCWSWINPTDGKTFQPFFLETHVDVNHRSKTRSRKLTSQKRWNLAGMDVENLKSHLFICEYPSPNFKHVDPEKQCLENIPAFFFEKFPARGTKVTRRMQKCSRLGLGLFSFPQGFVIGMTSGSPAFKFPHPFCNPRPQPLKLLELFSGETRWDVGKTTFTHFSRPC